MKDKKQNAPPSASSELTSEGLIPDYSVEALDEKKKILQGRATMLEVLTVESLPVSVKDRVRSKQWHLEVGTHDLFMMFQHLEIDLKLKIYDEVLDILKQHDKT